MRPLSIRNKLFVSFALLGIVTLSTSFFFIYNSAKQSLQTSIKDHLYNSTALISNLVQSVARTSIENHLKTISETQLLFVESLYEEYRRGRMGEGEAKKIAEKVLGRQIIGTSGYFYCLDSQGNVPVHPDKEIKGSNIYSFSFVQNQVRLKNGYIEYLWKNPGELAEREKVLYMVYFEPWDWIISASTYKSEFYDLVDIENLSAALSKITFGEYGYPYIFSTEGEIVYHPVLSGNLYELEPESILAGQQILQQQEGTIYYSWKNPDERDAREKISILEFLPEYGWVVASAAYLDELYGPLQQLRRLFLFIFLAYGSLILGASFALSTLVTNPLKRLIAHFKDKTATDANLITGQFSNDEVGTLAGYLNLFIAKLNEHHVQLEKQINERERSERTFHTLFDHSFQFIALLDPDCRICKINQTALSFRNLNKTDVIGKIFWETPWWKHSPTLIEQLKQAFSVACQGTVSRFEGYSNDVREVYLDISLKPVLDESDKVIYIIAEAREITDLRRTERELQQIQKMESVGTLAGGIAHDFNNILGGILGTVELLKLKRKMKGCVSDAEMVDALNTIDGTALRAKDMVNQLLTLSRKYDLTITPFDLSGILTNVSQIGRNSFDKSVTIQTDYIDEAIVKGDATSLEQVFLNVCINAAHSMTIMRSAEEPWGGTLSIQVSKVLDFKRPGCEQGNYWQVSITDTGVGMDSSDMDHIFTPFYTTKPKEMGTGLGLSMVFNIVRQHHGFIAVDSHKGKGSCFHIYLPVCDEQVTHRLGHSQALPESGDGLVLIIDDEELIRNNAKEVLHACGYRTVEAENGQQGVEIYQMYGREIDVVLLDLVMPVMSGKDAFTELKRLNPDVKVLLSSGFRHDARVDEVLEAGAVDYIQKPYSLFDLSRMIRRIIKR